jgi:hypothetical protein
MGMWWIPSQLHPKQSDVKIALRLQQVNVNGPGEPDCPKLRQTFTHLQKIGGPISPSFSAALSDGQRQKAAVRGNWASPKSTQSEARNREIAMKKEVAHAVLALSVVIGAWQASAQTPAYHANVLGISDGRTSIQVEIPTGLNRWGQ